MGQKNSETKLYEVDGKTFYSQAAADAYAEKMKSGGAGPSVARYGVLVFIGGLLAYWVLSSQSFWWFWHTEAGERVLMKSIAAGLLIAVLTALVGLWSGGLSFVRRTFTAFRVTRTLQNAAEDRGYLQALDEVEQGQVDRATWARALADSNGDSNAAAAKYIKLRARQLASNF